MTREVHRDLWTEIEAVLDEETDMAREPRPIGSVQIDDEMRELMVAQAVMRAGADPALTTENPVVAETLRNMVRDTVRVLIDRLEFRVSVENNVMQRGREFRMDAIFEGQRLTASRVMVDEDMLRDGAEYERRPARNPLLMMNAEYARGGVVRNPDAFIPGLRVAEVMTPPTRRPDPPTPTATKPKTKTPAAPRLPLEQKRTLDFGGE